MIRYTSPLCRRIKTPYFFPRASQVPLASCGRGPRIAQRWYASATQQSRKRTKLPANKDESEPVSQKRENQLNIQQLSRHVYEQVFPNPPKESVDERLVELSRQHLTLHQLYGKNSDDLQPIVFDLPKLEGQSMAEHFYKLGMNAAEPYRKLAVDFAEGKIPPLPKEWLRNPGWTKYVEGKDPEQVAAPEDSMLVFDVETLYKISPFAVMACAASPTAWYGWLSPWLVEGGQQDSEEATRQDPGMKPISDRQLIPLQDPKKEPEPRVIVGHNIGYDRARIKEEYHINQTQNAFLDTMSLHVAVSGMCSQQRPAWLKHRKHKKLKEQLESLGEGEKEDSDLGLEEIEKWMETTSINSLQEVAELHCKKKLNKEVRDQFGQLDRKGVWENFSELMQYCAMDVQTTFEVFQKVFLRFLNVCPHPVSFAALRHLSSVVLPVNEEFEAYVEKAENVYQKLLQIVQQNLLTLVEEALERKNDPDVLKDDWLGQLDWTCENTRITKEKKIKEEKKTTKEEKKKKKARRKKGEEEASPPPVLKQKEVRLKEIAPGEPLPEGYRLSANQKLPGYPKWYKDLVKRRDEDPTITVRSRIAALILRLKWEDYPLFWSDTYGWTFKVPIAKEVEFKDKNVFKCDFSQDEKQPHLKEDKAHVYYKLPHKDGPTARCVNPMSKSYLKDFEDGRLSSEYEHARQALEMNAQCSYWISSRQRIKGQMVVYEEDVGGDMGASWKAAKEKKGPQRMGIILPQLIPMGTITRRAVEKTWLTASNAKKNRVGSELKAMVKAPPGYHFVGADVDSQELWIASLIGDAQFKIHGGNALGFMTLEGTKSAGTDLHSKTAKILGISRNHAKVFNYGRIYGAGLKFAITLLQQFNPTLTDQQASHTATELYNATKGMKMMAKRSGPASRAFWYGGTESYVFNSLEVFADQDFPRTPVLGAGLTEALWKENLSKGGFLTSRINWAIQSSGVDYLHLLIISMDYLIRKFDLGARLAITVHDEIRYLVKTEHVYKAAMALQIANVWVRAMFSEQLGIHDLPQSCAYFSAVDIDTVLRKEVDLNCVTPSHPVAIPPGECLDMLQLLEKGEEAQLGQPREEFDFSNIDYEPSPPVMHSLQSWSIEDQIFFLRAQMAENVDAAIEVIQEWRAYQRPTWKKPTAADRAEAEYVLFLRTQPLGVGASGLETTQPRAPPRAPLAAAKTRKSLKMERVTMS